MKKKRKIEITEDDIPESVRKMQRRKKRREQISQAPTRRVRTLNYQDDERS
ncbi:MAG: hypothetical protein IKG42_00850 [Clostridia bacterium]|nr:hypothetical protein [Clostridia bacterium]